MYRCEWINPIQIKYEMEIVMRKKIIFFSLLMIISLVNAESQKVVPVQVSNYVINTKKYEEHNGWINFRCTPGPFTFYSRSAVAYRKQNSNKFDIYSFPGLCGTSYIPFNIDSTYILEIDFSCTMLDEDSEWEAIVNYVNADNLQEYHFKVYDDDGTEILADSGFYAVYGFDGKNTYIMNRSALKGSGVGNKMKAWRFRTNVLPQPFSALAKTKPESVHQFQMLNGFEDTYRISLSQTSDNLINFQVTNLRGESLFSKKIQNLSTPVTLFVPVE